MNLRAPQKNEKGFTIIEVMIVLAIAGLIILIVFLAVPALQRNSRNTQRRNDAARISGLVSEFVANNNGSLPSALGMGNGEIDIPSSNFSYYDVANLELNSASGDITDAEAIQIRAGVQCEANELSSAGNRSFAIAFAVETSGDAIEPQCV